MRYFAKSLAIILVLALAASAVPGCARHTHIVVESRLVGDFYCSIYEDDSIDVISYRGHAEELQVPERIDGTSVTGFGTKAFASCEELRVIYLPSTASSLPAKLFDSCPSLTTVYIPRSVRSIGRNVIYDCPSFTTILYEGTRQEWERVNVGSVPWTDNYVLINAEIVYEYRPGE